MIIEVQMPALSPTMTEGTLAKWCKNEGDNVEPGEIIAEIETDKATMEVEAVEEGVIGKILVEQGSNNVAVGTVIALIKEEGTSDEELENYTLKSSSSDAEHEKDKQKTHDNGNDNISNEVSSINHSNSLNYKSDSADDKSKGQIFASPLARRMAKNSGINLENINGSGPRGRIIKSDIEHAIANPTKHDLNKSESKSSIKSRDNESNYVLEPLSNMRKVIASRLVESKQQVPHFYLNIECNLDKLMKLRSEINQSAEKKDKISVNDFVIKATAKALKETPDANSSWSDDGIIKYNTVDISVAVAIEGGLITPIIRDADLKTLSEISQNMKDLATRAKKGKLMPEEYQGGNFSISNLGMYGIKQFNAIINPPQSCILAIGAGIRKPVVLDEQVKIATMIEITLSCDHRVVDGAAGAQLLSAFKEYIENPVKILI